MGRGEAASRILQPLRGAGSACMPDGIPLIRIPGPPCGLQISSERQYRRGSLARSLTRLKNAAFRDDAFCSVRCLLFGTTPYGF